MVNSADVCSAFQITNGDVKIWRDEGLPYTLIGNSCYYRLDDLYEFVALKYS
ncbi:MAG: hypothetical protein IPG12_03170 [Saprospiraceae bacterium]|nr:hypothetical protein [Saprospiraceae bacterium]